MIEEEAIGRFDCGALRIAIEGRDPDALLGFYAQEAELRIQNAALPGGVAFELRGRVQIERYLRAVCDQQMSCTIVGEVFADRESIAFVEVCGYPDGARISVKTTLELDEGGRILRQLEVVQSRRSEEAHREVSAEGSKDH
jgi:hypothetical protein